MERLAGQKLAKRWEQKQHADDEQVPDSGYLKARQVLSDHGTLRPRRELCQYTRTRICEDYSHQKPQLSGCMERKCCSHSKQRKFQKDFLQLLTPPVFLTVVWLWCVKKLWTQYNKHLGDMMCWGSGAEIWLLLFAHFRRKAEFHVSMFCCFFSVMSYCIVQ